MAGIDVSGDHGKRSVDAELNMVPMIDLLMCLICFLLITAVWSTMARVDADASVPGASGAPPDPAQPMLHVTIASGEKFTLSWRSGGAIVSTLDVPYDAAPLEVGRAAHPRFPTLARKVTEEWRANGAHRDASDARMDHVVLHCDDRAPYGEIIAVIDAVHQAKRRFPGGGATDYPAMNVTFAMAAN